MNWSKKLSSAILLYMFICPAAKSQEVEEQLYESNIAESEDIIRNPNESIGFFQRKQVNINHATAQELNDIQVLTPEQIKQFILFRNTFGNFVSLAELQAIPYWDVFTIKKILPFLLIENTTHFFPSFKEFINKSAYSLLYRTGGKIMDTLGKPASNQEKSTNNKNNYAQLISYRHKTKDLLQWGFTTEKDAGEKNVLDHTSAFIAIENKKILKQLIAGDFIVNLGQGLIHWQGHAFGKSSNLIQGYRQSQTYKPHTGTDENIFHRGIAIALDKNNIELSSFISLLPIDANIVTDNISGRRTVSSILTSGLHRTEFELEDKDALKQTTWGGRMAWNSSKGKIAINHVNFHHDIPISKRPLPYNQFAISGTDWRNTSMDYGWSLPIGFLFGEIAMDKHSNTALTAGVIKSLDSKFDLSLILRSMSSRYKAIQSNTLTQQGEAGNEKGFFICFNFTPTPKTRIEGFADHFMNSWPLYYNDGIRRGQSYAIQYVWHPDKKNELYLRWQQNQITNNQEAEQSRTNYLNNNFSNRIRFHLSSMIGESLTLRYRTEIIWIRKDGGEPEKGALTYTEMIMKTPRSPFSISIRFTWHETNSYASRLYAYERDVLSYHAVPAHYDNGNRSYLLLQYKLSRSVQLSSKCILQHRQVEPQVDNIAKYHTIRQVEWRVQLIWKIRS
jgi:hypothetical protein